MKSYQYGDRDKQATKKGIVLSVLPEEFEDQYQKDEDHRFTQIIITCQVLDLRVFRPDPLTNEETKSFRGRTL